MRPSLRLAALAGACLLAAPALADTTLFDDGRWLVVGIDAGGEPLPIAVTRDGAALGDFSELRIRPAGLPGSRPGEQLWIHADGTLTPMFAGVPGASAVLGRARECGAGLSAPLRVRALELPARSTGNGALELGGQLSNLDSLASEKLKLRVEPPSAEKLRVELSYRLVALRELCIDPEGAATQDEFRLVELRASYLSPSQHTNDLVRYVKGTDFDCDLFGDCDFDKVSLCAPLANETGYVLEDPKRAAGRNLELIHTTNLPEPTSSLLVELRTPGPGAVKPQGLVTASDDPAARNVAFWADWVDMRRETPAGKRLGRFRFALEAGPARSPGCDRTQS